jgi:hypothetical protein
VEREPDDYDPHPRLLATLVAGLLVVRLTDQLLPALLVLGIALAVIWGWP